MQYYPIHHKPRKLSVIGAMKDIQEYKIAKAQADLAPTLAEKAKTLWEWQKKDRTKDVRVKDLAIEKAEQDIVAKERETIIGAKKAMAEIMSKAYESTTTQEEFTDYLNTAISEFKKIPGFEDHVVDKDGNDLIDIAEIKREDAEKIWGAFYKDIQRISKRGQREDIIGFGGKVTPGEQLADKITEETKKTAANLTADALGKWLKDEAITDKEQKLIDKYLKDSKQTTQEAYEKTRQRLRAKVDEFEALVKRKATVGEIRRMFFADIYGILEPEEEEEPTPTEGKPVPAKLKDESLEDYLNRVAK